MSAWALTFLAIISVVVTVTSLAQVALMIGALIGLRRLQSLCTAAAARWQPMLDRAGRWALQGSRAVQAADQWLWESDAVGQGAGAVDVLSANGRGVPTSGVANRESAQPAAAVRPPLQPGQLGWQDIPGLLKAAGSAWVDDYAGSMGAALAYYTLFSLAPLLIIVIAVAGAVFGGEAVRGEVVAQLQGLIGRDGAQAVQGLLASASRPSTGVVAAAIGTVTLLLGATSVFAELQSTLDRIWRAPVPAEFGVWGTVRARLLSFGLVVTIGFLLLVSLVVSAALAAFDTWWGALVPGWTVALLVANALFSFLITTLLFASIYRILPHVRVEWREVWMGSAVTAALFTAGKTLIGLYLGHAAITSGFGAAGSIVVLLVWVYYSAQVFLLGAEFTWVYAGQRRKRAVGS